MLFLLFLQSKTFKIAKANEQRLQKVGGDVLSQEFHELLQLALDN